MPVRGDAAYRPAAVGAGTELVLRAHLGRYVERRGCAKRRLYTTATGRTARPCERTRPDHRDAALVPRRPRLPAAV